jgi:hypothetical protein
VTIDNWQLKSATVDVMSLTMPPIFKRWQILMGPNYHRKNDRTFFSSYLILILEPRIKIWFKNAMLSLTKWRLVDSCCHHSVRQFWPDFTCPLSNGPITLNSFKRHGTWYKCRTSLMEIWMNDQPMSASAPQKLPTYANDLAGTKSPHLEHWEEK